MGEISYTSYRSKKRDDALYYTILSGSGGINNGGSPVGTGYLKLTGETSQTVEGNVIFTGMVKADSFAVGVDVATEKIHVVGNILATDSHISNISSRVVSSDTSNGTYIGMFKGIGSLPSAVVEETLYYKADEEEIMYLATTNSKFDYTFPFLFQALAYDVDYVPTLKTDHIALFFAAGDSYIGRWGALDGNGSLYVVGLDGQDLIKLNSYGTSFITGETNGLHIGANTSISYKFQVTGNSYFTEDVFYGTHLNSPIFVSGFAGSGWKLENDGTNATLTVDNLYVRKTMNVYELVINKIRSTNGSLWVSDAVKISNVVGSTCYIDTDGGTIAVPFVADDIIRCQRWTGRGIKYYTAKVLTVDAGGAYFTFTVIDGTDSPAIGDDVVRVGNATNTNRQGALYLTSSDSNSPYLDVLNEVTGASFAGKTKVRLGRLDGISDSDFGGSLSGYGLYSTNVYLKGKIVIASGSSGFSNFTDMPNTLKTPSGTGIFITSTYMGYYTGGVWTAYMDASGNFKLGDVTGGASGLSWNQSAGTLAIRGTINITGGTGFGNMSDVPNALKTPSGTGLFITNSYMGYYDSGTWKTYMDNSGNFSLGNVSTGKGLSWNQSTGVLTIKGNITSDSGDIGGFIIQPGYLTGSTNTNADRFVLYPSDFIAFLSGNTYKWSGIGNNVFPATSSAVAVARFENREDSIQNVGIYIDVAGGGFLGNDVYGRNFKNHALYISRGDITMYDGKLHMFQEFRYYNGGGGTWDPFPIWESQKWVFNHSARVHAYLPSATELNSYGIDGNSYFSVSIKVLSTAGSDVLVYSNGTTGQIYDFGTSSHVSFQLNIGNSYAFLYAGGDWHLLRYNV
jgi:hypothetical protein